MRRIPLVLLFLVSLSICVPASSFGAADTTGQWGPLLDWGIQGKHMSVLPTGDVLVWATGDNARVWRPATGGFTNTPALFGDLHCAGQATLADGRTIVLGGVNGPPHVGTNITALFDPFTNTWRQGTPMFYERWYGSVTTLADGKVLGSSGDDSKGNRVLIPEVYDPVSNSWTKLTSASRDQSLYPFMYLLPNGKVYEAGSGSGTALLTTTGTGSWASGPSNAYGTSGYSESSAQYEPGKVIRSGGGDPAIARTSIIDMNAASPQWQQVANMANPRRRHNLVIMADGQVLAVGGTRSADDETKAVLPCEIWNPTTKAWTTVASLAEARMYHSAAVLLPDGRVVSAGGEAAGRLRAQIYSPPYLFKGARPTISSAPAAASYGNTFFVGTPDGASITKVAILRPGAATHAWDQNQRYVPLTFTQASGGLSVNAPASGALAPPGYYMLVIQNGNGVPSIAKYVQFASSGNLAPGTVLGKVTDASNGQAVSGAMVSFGAGSTTTDTAGNYTLNNVPPGDRTITAFKTGYATASKDVTVVAGQTSTVNIALARPGSVAGSVKDSTTNAGIPGATVTYDGGSVTTDASGNYTIAEIASGSQLLTASATNYAHQQQTVNVPANGSTTANFVLTISSTFITGQVIDASTLVPIVGATVAAGVKSSITDANGVYKINDTPPATYDVTASASGHVSETHTVVVTTGAYATSDFALSPIVGGSRIKDITFEGAALTGATGADDVTGTVNLNAATPVHGYYSARVKNETSYLTESFTAANDLYVSFYLRLNATPTESARILKISSAGTTIGNIELRSSGTLRLRNDSTQVGAETAKLTVANLYRVGIHQGRGTGSNAVLEAFLATGDNAFGTPFAKMTNGTWKTAADKVKAGSTSAGVVDIDLDDISLDSAVMPGPSGGTPAPTPPSADFTGTPTSGTVPFDVDFQDRSSGSLVSWLWNFGDGSATSTVRNPSHTYTTGGIYTVMLTVTNEAGSDTETKTSYINATGTAPAPQTLFPAADAHVNQDNPTANYGTATTLRVRTNSTAGNYYAYLKFTVTNQASPPTSAKLRLFVTDESSDGGSVYSVGNNWTETGITWNNALTNAPISGSPIRSIGNAAAGAWVEVDVTSKITGNGTFSFAIKSANTNSVYYSSREGTSANRPQLVLR